MIYHTAVGVSIPWRRPGGGVRGVGVRAVVAQRAAEEASPAGRGSEGSSTVQVEEETQRHARSTPPRLELGDNEGQTLERSWAFALPELALREKLQGRPVLPARGRRATR